MTEQRFKKAEFAAWIGIIGNALLAVMKGIIGVISNSKALIADAAHSASDVGGSFAVLIGIKAAKMPPDKDHPYGHGKAESIAAIIVSVLLLIIGFEIASSTIQTLISGVEEPPKGIAIIALIVSIIVKEAMYQYKYRLGKQLSSQALIANAIEHRSDVFSSFAALLGVIGALIGNALDMPYLLYLDPIAGIFVALLIMKMGYGLVKEAIHNTMDHVLHDEDAAGIKEAALKVQGVINIDELRAREHGHYVIVDVKLSVSPNISVQDGHSIGKKVKKTLMEQFNHVADVFVHVNPYKADFPYEDIGSALKTSSSKLIH
ncbi:cation diffusion facilitator family transporter [Longirhabdus pacifica]|uniref:cation diffusion facilitator family transporter n=1 Tax=Longirhabdus pacifica TaxID=2305227 RepID=UPI0010086ACD|nr:cation diffusion facilitator family transporter [Longirhabdus pacifica]